MHSFSLENRLIFYSIYHLSFISTTFFLYFVVVFVETKIKKMMMMKEIDVVRCAMMKITILFFSSSCFFLAFHNNNNNKKNIDDDARVWERERARACSINNQSLNIINSRFSHFSLKTSFLCCYSFSEIERETKKKKNFKENHNK